MTNSNDRRFAKLRQSLQKRGKKLPKDIRHLASAVLNESDDQLSHQDCIVALPAYVDAEIEGLRVANEFPLVKRHLAMCAECADQYAQLLELTLAEQSRQIPTVSLPVPNLAFLPPSVELVDFVKQKAAEILAAIAPTQVRDLQTIANVFFERVNALGGKFVLQPSSAQVLGLGVGGANEALTTLAVTYAAAQEVLNSFTPDQIESLAAQNQLRTKLEEKARTAAATIHVKPKLAKQISEQFAQYASYEPAALRGLIEQQQK